MKVSTFLKGCILTAALLLLSTEAFAQLPVRTQTLQLIGPGGTLTMTTANTTPYSVIWPADLTAVVDGEDAVIVATRTGTSMQFNWQQINNTLIDGLGVLNQIAYFSDPNTIVSSANFVVDPVGGSVSIGVAATPGSIIIASATGSATIESDAATANTYNFPSSGPVGTKQVVATTTIPAGAGEIPISQADGSIVWTANPLLNAQRGIAGTTGGSYTTAITVVGTPDANDMIIVTSSDYTVGPTGNILVVTGTGLNTITVSGTGPFTGTDLISWLWIPIP